MIQKVTNIRKKEKYIFADADYRIRNLFVMDPISEADLKAAPEFQDNVFILGIKDDIYVMSFFFVYREPFFKKRHEARVCL
jgi:hypothetical protein